ncbi:MAG TPA: DNA translocase FtsK 4TM domain-containing protein [Atribacteraceae bacterium]|nr:DNA translocase FtsK 4TM domain-containing protein [Atribacteraceae bacterium]
MPGKPITVLSVSIIILFALYALLALASFDVGIFGKMVGNTLLRGFGVGAYAVPFLLFCLAYEIARFSRTGKFRSIGRLAGLTSWFFIFLTLSQWRAYASGFYLETGAFAGLTGEGLYRLLSYYLGDSGMLLFLFLLAFLGTFAIGEGRWVRSLFGLVGRMRDTLAAVPFIRKKDERELTPEPRRVLRHKPPESLQKYWPEDVTFTPKEIPEAGRGPKVYEMETGETLSEVCDDSFNPDDLVVQSGSGGRQSAKAPRGNRPRRKGALSGKKPGNVRSRWTLPETGLLDEYASRTQRVSPTEVQHGILRLEQTLSEFSVAGKVVNVMVGPTITRYEFQPAPGVKVNKITSLSNDIALSFAAAAVRIEAPIPGKSAVGIEIPNEHKEIVSFRELVESKVFQRNPSPLLMALGKDVTGKLLAWDMKNAPHLLIAGATGSGKSVCINSILASFLFRADPNQLRIALIDPKKVELSLYTDLPHLCAPVISEVRWVVKFLKWMCREMDSRYHLLSDLSTRNIEEYNALVEENERLPYVVVVIDELADLMMTAPADVEAYICRLAQMARAVGIHLLLATQRPSVDVITGLIKANFPSRLAFAVSSQADSKTILDGVGAEKLLGNGDLLFSPVGINKAIRGQGAYLSTSETKRVVEHWLSNSGEINYPMEFILKDDVEDDLEEEEELYREAISIVVENGKASTSLLQRRLRIGFNRAARLIEKMERDGVVGPYEGSKPRKVMVNKGD